MSQNRPLRATLLSQIEAVKQSAIAGVTAERLEPWLDRERKQRVSSDTRASRSNGLSAAFLAASTALRAWSRSSSGATSCSGS